MTLHQEMTMTRSNANGKIDLDVVVDAVNSLDAALRPAVVAALRERAPEVLWTIAASGRATADHIMWTSEGKMFPATYGDDSFDCE